MRSLRAFLLRLTGLLDKSRKDRELVEELESHLRMQIEDNLRSGMAPAEARRTALLKAGGIESAKEACRDRRGLPVLETAIRDLHHALRLLSRSPAFTLVAVLSLGLGIGANTAIFTLLDQLLLRRLPVKNPEQLQMIWTTGPNFGSNQGSRASSYPMYQDFGQRAPAFSQVFCRYYTPLSISLGNQTERSSRCRGYSRSGRETHQSQMWVYSRITVGRPRPRWQPAPTAHETREPNLEGFGPRPPPTPWFSRPPTLQPAGRAQMGGSAKRARHARRLQSLSIVPARPKL